MYYFILTTYCHLVIRSKRDGRVNLIKRYCCSLCSHAYMLKGLVRLLGAQCLELSVAISQVDYMAILHTIYISKICNEIAQNHENMTYLFKVCLGRNSRTPPPFSNTIFNIASLQKVNGSMVRVSRSKVRGSNIKSQGWMTIKLTNLFVLIILWFIFKSFCLLCFYLWKCYLEHNSIIVAVTDFKLYRFFCLVFSCPDGGDICFFNKSIFYFFIALAWNFATMHTIWKLFLLNIKWATNVPNYCQLS